MGMRIYVWRPEAPDYREQGHDKNSRSPNHIVHTTMMVIVPCVYYLNSGLHMCRRVLEVRTTQRIELEVVNLANYDDFNDSVVIREWPCP